MTPKETNAQQAPDGGGSMVLRSSFDPEHRVVAVTGAHSFLGEQLIKRLESDRRYLKVLAIDIRKPDIPMVKTQFYKLDLTLPTADAEIAQILHREEADTLVHLAFLSKPTHNSVWAHELEAIGTMHVLNACSACKIHKVIMWSLTALYGANPQNPNFLTEEYKTAGTPYSRFFSDKLEAERLFKRFGQENSATVVTIIRTASLLGHQNRSYVSKYFSLPVVPTLMGYDPLVQFLHESDAVEIFKLSVDADFNGEYNVAGGGVLPLSTALALAGKITVAVPGFMALPAAQFLWMTQILDTPPVFFNFLRYLCVADCEKIEREIGFTPRYDIRDILADFSGRESTPLLGPQNTARGYNPPGRRS